MTEETLFERAVQLPAGERAAFLDRECAGQTELRGRVEALLAADAATHSPLDHPIAVPERTGEYTPSPEEPQPASRRATDPRPDSQAGAVIAGKYTLVEVIGAGGMGAVWRAKQTEPVKRFVAIKLIKVGMDSKQVLARFDAERQALALMDHPNIAKVLDGGLHDHRPFFVMELVKGVPITDYCDANKLTPQQRLELFVQACQAIQHAHQKGIIHRDIKPSNVLVALYDDKPVVKVIDFGVAKATGGTLTEATIDTGFGGVVGTQQYMSPEQATFNNLDIDTRSDVYALGVLLYELLTGSPPFSKKDLEQKGLLEMLRVVREEEPPRPSTRLSTADALPNIAANRSIEPAKLAKLLQGELDWVVMKALEKDRTRRYDTANGLARDIQRYLADEVVEARPPSHGYRLKKFVKRNKVQVAAAGLVLFALVAGIAGITWGLLQAQQSAEAERQAKVEADAKRIEAESQQRRAEAGEKLAGDRLVEVEAEKRTALAVKDFLQNKLLAQADLTFQHEVLQKLAGGGPVEQVKHNPTVRELLDRAARELTPAKVEASFPGQPMLQAEILQTVGRAYTAIDEPKLGLEFLQRSLALRKQHLGPDHADTLTAMSSLGEAYEKDAPGAQSKAIWKEAFELSKAKLGPGHPDTLRRMMYVALAVSGDDFRSRVNVALLEDSVKLMKSNLGTDHPITLEGMMMLGLVKGLTAQRDEAVPILKETLNRTRSALGTDHPQTQMAIQYLGIAYSDSNKTELAIPLLEESLKYQKARFGVDHPATLRTMDSLGTAYKASGKLDQSLAIRSERVQISKAKRPDAPDTFMAMFFLANDYKAAGKADLAIAIMVERLKLLQAKYGPDHSLTLIGMGSLVQAYRKAGKADLVIPIMEEHLNLLQAKFGPDHSLTLIGMGSLAAAYGMAGKWDQAFELRTRVVQLTKAKFGPDHPETLKNMESLASEYQSAGKVDQGLALRAEVLQLTKAKFGPDHPETFKSMGSLAEAYRMAGKGDQALELRTKVVQLTRAKFGPDHPETFKSMEGLASEYRSAGKVEQGLALGAEVVQLTKAKFGPDHPETLKNVGNLAKAYLKAGKADLAVPLFEETIRLQKAILGTDHTDTIISMMNLGDVYRKGSKLDQAVKLYEEALTGLKANSSKDSHDISMRTFYVTVCRGMLFRIYLQTGEKTKGLAHLSDALASYRKTLPKESPVLADVLVSFSEGLINVKAFTEAEPLLREGLAIREKTQPDAWTTFATQSLLGAALLGQKKYADAEPLLVKGYERMKAREKSIPPKGAIRVPNALDRLIELYTATNKPDEVKKYKELRAKYEVKK